MARTKLRGYQIGDYEILLSHLNTGIQLPTTNLADGAEFIKRAGTVAFTGDLNMNSHKIVNVLDGVAVTDGVSLGQFNTGLTTANTNLTAETTARTNADNVLQTNINNEIAARTTADSGITANLNSEITNRTAADATIVSDLASTVLGKGAATVGINDAGSLYAATTVEDALSEVVTKINTAQSQLTLQGVYNNTPAVSGVANIKLTTGKDFRLTDDTDDLVFFQVDSETGGVKMTGPVAIEGALLVSGATTQINSAVTSYDFITLSPSGSGKALEIRPTAAYIGNTVMDIFKSSTAVTSSLNINTDGVVKVEAIQIAGADVATSLSNETAARIAGDSTAETNITNETTARIAGDSTIVSNLASTVTGKGASTVGVEDFAGNYVATTVEGVLTEIQTKITNVASSGADALNTEITNRTAADTTLQTNINNETTARTAADGVLQTNINNETSARVAADTAIRSDLASTALNLGGSLVGIYDVDNYYTAATVEGALKEIKEAVNVEASTRSAADTTLTSTKYDKTGGTISGSADVTGAVSVGTTLNVVGATTLSNATVTGTLTPTAFVAGASFNGSGIRIANIANGTDNADAVTLYQLNQAIAQTGTASEWQESVIDVINDPPANPATGARYLVGTAPTGSFLTHTNAIAVYTLAGWVFTDMTISKVGTFLSVDSQTDRIYYWGGTAWTVKYFEATTGSNGIQKVGFDIQLAPTCAGTGLTFNSGVINVVSGDGLDAQADQLNLTLDGTTLTKSVTGLKVGAGGITATEINSLAISSGLTGGNGSAVSVVAGNGVAVGTNVAVKLAVTGSGLQFDSVGGLEVIPTTMTIDRLIFRDPFTGVIDGVNKVFTLSKTPVVGTEQVFLNGILQYPAGEDYTISGAVITFVVAPLSTERLAINYVN